MIIADNDSLACMFNEDFVQGAANLFKNLALTDDSLILNRSHKVSFWVYDVLGYEIRLSKFDHWALSTILDGGEIQSIVTDNKDKIRIFAIELKPMEYRSLIAYSIQKIFSNVAGDCSIILFRQEMRGTPYCMFSLDTGNDIILSDWYSPMSDDSVLTDVGLEYLSRESARAFQQDFGYIVERDYYRHPFSKAVVYELFEYCGKAYCLPYGAFDWERFHKDVDYLRIKPFIEYGDDYIEPKHGDAKGNAADELEIPMEELLKEPKPPAVIMEEQNLFSTPAKEKDEIDLLIERLGKDVDNPIAILKALEKEDVSAESARGTWGHEELSQFQHSGTPVETKTPVHLKEQKKNMPTVKPAPSSRSHETEEAEKKAALIREKKKRLNRKLDSLQNEAETKRHIIETTKNEISKLAQELKENVELKEKLSSIGGFSLAISTRPEPTSRKLGRWSQRRHSQIQLSTHGRIGNLAAVEKKIDSLSEQLIQANKHLEEEQSQLNTLKKQREEVYQKLRRLEK